MEWIASCPLCQKYRLGGKEIILIPSPIASLQIFEELGIDFIGPLPRDDVGNSYICNCVCMTTHYFAVEAASAVIAAHCLLSVVARYGSFRSVRSLELLAEPLLFFQDVHRGLIEETLICDLQLHNILVSKKGDYLRIFNRAKEAAIKISRGPVNQPMGAAANSGLPSANDDPLGQRQHHRPDRTKILRSHKNTEVTHDFRPVPLYYRVGLRALVSA
jgi:hypothetical protein